MLMMMTTTTMTDNCYAEKCVTPNEAFSLITAAIPTRTYLPILVCFLPNCNNSTIERKSPTTEQIAETLKTDILRSVFVICS